jgi:hypothetical protein
LFVGAGKASPCRRHECRTSCASRSAQPPSIKDHSTGKEKSRAGEPSKTCSSARARDASADIAHDLKPASAVLLVDVMRADVTPPSLEVWLSAAEKPLKARMNWLAWCPSEQITAQKAYDYHRHRQLKRRTKTQ